MSEDRFDIRIAVYHDCRPDEVKEYGRHNNAILSGYRALDSSLIRMEYVEFEKGVTRSRIDEIEKDEMRKVTVDAEY